MKDELIALAKEAGIVTAHNTEHLTIEGLECFATLVAAKKQEECAKVCDDIGEGDNGYGCASAIRGMKP